MKKVVIAIISLVGVIFGLYFSFYSDKEVIVNNKTNKNIDNKLLSIMVGSLNAGYYENYKGNSWPVGYEFNENLSKCENGSDISWDEEKQKVIVKSNISDKCYIYFDKIPDLSINSIYNSDSEVPSTVGPSVTLNCSGTSAKYNTQYNRLEIESIANKATCDLTYTNRSSKTFLNNKVISLSGTTQGTGQVVNEKGYRYEGKNPNNYIWFNNELWRIIGVFDEESHGQTGQKLTKIIRNKSLGGLTYHRGFSNDWSNASSLKSLLNPIEGNTHSGSYYNKFNDVDDYYCYSYYGVKINCDYSKNGINSSYREMIKNVTWYLGGLSSNSSDSNYFETSVNNIYLYERGTIGSVSNPTLLSDTGYIGLIYPSDYFYSVLASDCPRTTDFLSSSNCSMISWLNNNAPSWTITPSSNTDDHAFLIAGFVPLWQDYVYFGENVFPTVYLDSDVYVISGNGSLLDPYIIGM